MSTPAEVCQRTRSSDVRKVAMAKSTSVAKARTGMVSMGRKKAARKKSAMEEIVHQTGMGQPPEAAKVRNSNAARPAMMAAKTVTIQSLPKKISAATIAMRTIAVRMRFMCLVEDTLSRGRRERAQVVDAW